MAFQDIEKILYDGQIKLVYKDKAHRYYVYLRANYDLAADDPKAWGKAIKPAPRGVTTLIGETLEKKGLMNWSMREALKYLFGFYGSFENDKGEKIPAGFSKGVGELWTNKGDLKRGNKEEMLPIINAASREWIMRQKKGADIGSVVHNAIEHYILEKEFDIQEEYMYQIEESFPDDNTEREAALEAFEEDTAQAILAFDSFKKWWDKTKPFVVSTEEIVYSKEYNIAGTYDINMKILKGHHPVYKNMDEVNVIADWKTSKAYADAPEGISYDYFLQNALYELCRREMGLPSADDFLVVSARKDGGFNTIYASEIGLSIDGLLDYAKSVIKCNENMKLIKENLKKHAEI